MNMMPHISNAISVDLSPMGNMNMAQTISDNDSLNILLLHHLLKPLQPLGKLSKLFDVKANLNH